MLNIVVSMTKSCRTKCHMTASLIAIQGLKDNQYGSMMNSVGVRCLV